MGHVLAAMESAHPYEEVAHDVLMMDNAHPTAGSGGIGSYDEPLVLVRFRVAPEVGVRRPHRPAHSAAGRA